MFNLGKLSKLFFRFRNIPISTNAFQPTFFGPLAQQSLIDVNRQYFGIKKKFTGPKKIKERTKSAALSDEKAAKLSKAEEEAEQKKRKMEAEKAKLEKDKKPEAHIKTQLMMFENKIGKKKKRTIRERIRRENLGLEPETYEEILARTVGEKEEGEEGEKEEVKESKEEKKEKAPKAPEKNHILSLTMNTMPKREEPSLRKKVIHEYFNSENIVNSEFWKRLKYIEPHDDTKRAGIISVKVGMTALFDKWGVRIPVTVLQVDRCQVVQIKTKETDGYWALQLGAGARNFKYLKKPEIGHFMKANVPAKRVLREFHISPENVLPIGYQMSVRHFTPGQYVDVTGITIGKGFQGTIKRYGFKLQPKSHGNSLSHRKLGSTGQRQDPSRVFKNKKMPGRMGGVQRTIQSLQVYKIDVPNSLIYIKGHVPGKPGTAIFLKDAWRKRDYNLPYLNCPTFIPKENSRYAQEIVMKAPEQDPLEEYLHDNTVVDRE